MLKFLPALALAVALAPVAANAQGNQFSNQNPAHHQYLASIPNAEQVSANSLGRAGEFNAPLTQIVVDSTSQYAAAGAPQND